MNKAVYIHRRLEKPLKEAAAQFPAVVVTGPRQSGKSTLLKKLFSKTHEYLTLDDLTVRERAVSDPKAFLETAAEHLIIDEIQYAPHLLSYIKILIDQERHKKGRFILTGSQQFILIKNLGDSLAGRLAIFELLPFSLEETRSALLKKISNTSSEEFFLNACLQGSYPEIVLDGNLDPEKWYSAYLQTYLERDVRTLHNIGNLRDFHRFLQSLASRCSQVLNLSSIASDLGVAVNTIKRWISVLEASRIIYLLSPYYQNLGKRMTKSPKIYFLDCGLACYLLGMRDKNSLLNGPFAGPLFENFCLQETVKSFLHKGVREQLYYVRTPHGLEIDLLVENNGKLYPVEFKKTKTLMPALANPMQRLKNLFSKWPLAPGRIVSLSPENISLHREAAAQSIKNYLHWLENL